MNLKIFRYTLFALVLVSVGTVLSFPNYNISQNSAAQNSPNVAISHKQPNKAVCVWKDYRLGPLRAGYSYSTNGGVTWSAPLLLDSSLTAGYSAADNPSVCVDTAGNFYIAVRVANSLDSARIAVYKSTNGGITFPTAIIIPGSYTGSSFKPPAVVCDLSPSSPFGNAIYVTWVNRNNNTFLSKSTNGGLNWSSPVSTGQGLAYRTSLAVSPNGQINLLSMWTGGFAKDIYSYKRSTDGGLTFSTERVIDSCFTLSAYMGPPLPSIACDISGGARNGYMYCVFGGGSLTNGDIDAFLTRSTDYGNTWSPHVRIHDSIPNRIQWLPSIAVNSQGRIAINFYDFRNGGENNRYFEMWLARSNDGGITFSNDLLSSMPSLGGPPGTLGYAGNSVGIDYWGNTMIPVWNDRRGTDMEIYTAIHCGPLYTVSGQVTYRDNGQPVNSGKVKALRYNRFYANIVVVDSAQIQPGGLYTLPNFPQDSLDIMYYQNDDLLQFVPTYYVSTIDWQQATPVYPTQNLTNINGQVYRIINSGGPFHIGGYTYNSAGALSDAVIYAKIGNDFKNYGMSLVNGSYVATQLPAGTYTMYAYRMGYNYVTRSVTISNNSSDTTDFFFGSPIGIISTNGEIPSSFKLYQNYPNPFNPTTRIEFEIPPIEIRDNVFLRIYDILGREIATIVNENLKPGTYEIEWDGTNFSSGLYFYELRAGDYLETKKMVLLK